RAEGATVENGVIHVRRRRHTVRFSGVAARPVLSVNRGFSAPVTLSMEMSQEDRLFLARKDGDLFSRWQALNGLFTDALIAAFRRIRGGKPTQFEPALVAHPAVLAADDELEHAFRALALTLPAESDIAREIGENVDPDAIHKARNALQRAIAAADGGAFAKIYAALEDRTPFS